MYCIPVWYIINVFIFLFIYVYTERILIAVIITEMVILFKHVIIIIIILYIQWKKKVKNITSWHKTLSASAVKVNKIQDAA